MNYIILAAALSWTVAQLIKTVTHLVRYKTLSLERLLGAGGMPSSHSAMVCSALAAVFRKEGFSSTYFAITALFAFIVMYDAMGVRRAAGLHAREINKINKIVEETSEVLDIEMPVGSISKRLRSGLKGGKLPEFLGHTPFEVFGGAVLGLIFGMIVPMK